MLLRCWPIRLLRRAFPSISWSPGCGYRLPPTLCCLLKLPSLDAKSFGCTPTVSVSLIPLWVVRQALHVCPRAKGRSFPQGVEFRVHPSRCVTRWTTTRL